MYTPIWVYVRSCVWRIYTQNEIVPTYWLYGKTGLRFHSSNVLNSLLKRQFKTTSNELNF